MKIMILTILLISWFFLTTAWAGELNYVKVPGWQNCAIAFERGPFKLFCLPQKKPDACSSSSWQTLRSGLMLPLCPLCPPKKNQ